MAKELKTGWGGVANWYHDTVEEKGSYQKDLILPNLLRTMDIKKGETVLDLACGEGFFARRFARSGATVIGTDISKELIAIAKREAPADAKAMAGKPAIDFRATPSDNVKFVKNGAVDKIAIVLALQNIENVSGTLSECSRVLTAGGKLYLVLNHPAFRIPKQSSWGFDEEQKIQYRRLDGYLSERRQKIEMHPGEKGGEVTISFHRPLQFFIKALRKAGLAVTNMEEWSSTKKSQPGPRAEAENKARKEFPLFLFLEATKLS